LVLFGLLALFRIPVQLVPSAERAEVSVRTLWPGASPEEIEREIVMEQEDQLKNVEGLIRMTSVSQDSLGTILLEFPVGTDLTAALVRVANRLNQVPEYPERADEPVLTTVDVDAGAMAWFLLRRLPGNERPIDSFRDLVEEEVKPRLERVPGVSQANFFGGRELELQVIVDPDALAARGVTIAEVERALARENRNVSAGDFDEGKRRYLVRTLGEYRRPEEVEGVVVARRNGNRIFVRDIAEVRLDYKKSRFVVRAFGVPTIAMNAIREPGSNVMEVMAGVRAALRELNGGILADQGVELLQAYDETEYIDSAIALVRQNIYAGGALGIGVLLLFLRSGRSVVVIATAIPISIVGTFLAMAAAGRNINVISLAGMSFAVGMVVDNAIVVLENIYRHWQGGKSARDAAHDGTSEVWGAVLASTLTTMAVFLPVLYVREEAGQLFRDIAIAVSCAVGLSLLVSVTVIPSLGARILGGPEASRRDPAGSTWKWLRPAARVPEAVAGGIHRLSGSTAGSLTCILLLTGASALLVFALLPKAEYLPQGNQNFVFGILLPPPGYSFEELSEVGRHIEQRLEPHFRYPGLEAARNPRDPVIDQFWYAAWGSQAFVGGGAEDPGRARDLIPILQAPMSEVPGVFGFVVQWGLFQRDIRGSRTIDIEIHGPELARLIDLGREALGRVVQAIPGAQVQPEPSLDISYPQVQVVPDRVRLADAALDTSELGRMVDVLLDGARVSEFRHEGREIDLTLMGEEGFAGRTQDFENLLVRTPGGGLVPLGSVASVRLATGPEQIHHIERDRAVTIHVTPPEAVPLEEAMERVEAKVVGPLEARGDLGGSYHAEIAGSADDLTVTRRALQWNFLLAVVITYLLMAALFESFLYPFVIMLSVPFAATGGFLGLWLVNRWIAAQPLDVLTMLGFVILVGIVVNNAILIVHQALNRMREGLDPRAAVRDSVRTRIRPIAMTVTTTVFGMAPLVLFPGAGSELYRGIGSVVVGGLVVSTVFTVFLVPLLFTLTLRARDRVAAAAGGAVRALPRLRGPAGA
ncbi:MAG: efflux RND transporter permease subunit, partial [Acidobacteria bacterium]|nr:efflux RND transporter permease subunit [Acidobacteriota bacterium]